MDAAAHLQANRLIDLIRAANAGLPEAQCGTLFCSRAGLALVNAAFELFECDGLYDLACDVGLELGCDRRGVTLGE